MNERQHDILTLIDEGTLWEGDTRPGVKLTRYFIPRRIKQFSATLRKDVWLNNFTQTLKSLHKRGFVERITRADPYGCAITERGILALEQYREKHIYIDGKFPAPSAERDNDDG